MDKTCGRQAVRSHLITRHAPHLVRIEERDIRESTRLKPAAPRHQGNERFEELRLLPGRLGNDLQHGQAAVIDGDPQIGPKGTGAARVAKASTERRIEG